MRTLLNTLSGCTLLLAAILILSMPSLGKDEVTYAVSDHGNTVKFVAIQSQLRLFWLPLALSPGKATRAYDMGGKTLWVKSDDQLIPVGQALEQPPKGIPSGFMKQAAELVQARSQWQEALTDSEVVEPPPVPEIPQGFGVSESGSGVDASDWPARLAIFVLIAATIVLYRKAQAFPSKPKRPAKKKVPPAAAAKQETPYRKSPPPEAQAPKEPETLETFETLEMLEAQDAWEAQKAQEAWEVQKAQEAREAREAQEALEAQAREKPQAPEASDDQETSGTVKF